ncbi:CsgA protein [Myxococcus stipitatus DSM 14675]|uniref:CsgA protein n=1 Tax=Myxococcus stipitatus (strain DSM 14675 / JCM 12634 / Mx s8) TaxID=1278073 RepID=L7U741_MYXSD|nr:SDR family oxidoreductase [Myxococcus stipitatus]AGC43382.1 CsgA protein [Myxococcus stipitatus DSM 14675]
MNVVISGANRGIGLELVRQCLQRGDEVHAGVRAPERASELAALAQGAHGPLHLHALDVTDEASVRAFAAAIPGPVHLLINNAGVRSRPDDLAGLDSDDLTRTFQVNAVAALRMTLLLRPQLRAAGGAKVANLSSNLGSIADNSWGGAYGYRMSKAALNMATRSLGYDLKEDGILAFALSPGWVRTDMGGSEAPTAVDLSVSGLLSVLGRLGAEDTGGFFDFEGKRLPW